MILTIDTDKLAGISELASLFGVNRSCICQWRTRYKDFPQPIRQLRSGPIFIQDEVIDWVAGKCEQLSSRNQYEHHIKSASQYCSQSQSIPPVS